MCGLAGAIGPPDRIDHLDAAVLRMCERMRARGPDGAGHWRDPAAGVVLGHRRLAILDLDERANQPMQGSDATQVLVFNGEIYNFLELRDALVADGERWRTRSDTEVLLALFRREGPAMLRRLRGMFAIALWDGPSGRMFLARDPYGIKPLYVGRGTDGWLVASQVKALLASGQVAHAPDPLGQAGYWLLGSVPEPNTWFRDISAVPAGHYQWLDASGPGPAQCYHDIGAAWRDAESTDASEPADLPARVADALLRSVRAHLVSDVPVGVFLSGGIDSSSLAALMREAGAESLQGVTLGFEEFAGSEDDEVPVARRIAAGYGIGHAVRAVHEREFCDDWPRILEAMDQPSVDGVNTWYASKAAAEQGLKVVVSGVGGDELFQGYRSFRELPALASAARALGRVPGASAAAGKLAGWQARRSGNARWGLLPGLAETLPGAWYLRRGLATASQLPALMGADLFHQLGAAADPVALVRGRAGPLAQSPPLAVGQLESLLYLRNQLLRDSDWASMDHGVELRTPLVDAWLLAELAPWFRHFHRYPAKSLLSGAPAQALPDDIARRPKTGFGTPVARWLDALPGDSGLPGALARSRTARLAHRVATGCYA
jgi:asparagine synthase (glutamine-hydrolysing)